MSVGENGRLCKWCGTTLASNSAAFCANCDAPQTRFATFLYALNFIAKNLAIPLVIGVVTLMLTTRQQEASLNVANRQKLADALVDFGRLQADSRLAYTQIEFMALPNGTNVPAKDLKDATARLDVAIASFGAKLAPFEEFVRRTGYYNVEPLKASPLQRAWDNCFVQNYWGEEKKPGYLTLIEENLTKCDDTNCPKAVAQEIRRIHSEFYKGYCKNLYDRSGRQVNELPLIWFSRELKRISVQASRGEDIYVVGEE